MYPVISSLKHEVTKLVNFIKLKVSFFLKWLLQPIPESAWDSLKQPLIHVLKRTFVGIVLISIPVLLAIYAALNLPIIAIDILFN
jgi:hypothetical protein